MSPKADSNKKRKYDGPSPQGTNQSDTGSILSNLPALPPAPPNSSPPSQSQGGGAGAGGTHNNNNTHSNSNSHNITNNKNTTNNSNVANNNATYSNTTNMSGGAGGNQATSSQAGGGGGRQSSGTGGGPASKRPKRARGKGEKKEENECPSRFHCDYCGRDLSHSVRARCAICLDYDSCLDCFSVGAALEPHKADHDYRLIEVVHTPIFQEDWSADEEEKLLEGLETFGIGNWEQVAKLIGSKSPIETEQHYLQVYLQGNAAPLPDQNRLEPVLDLTGSDALMEPDDPKALRVMHKHQQEDAAGWMPKRQDFVYEWDNDAEEIIGDMDITEEDTKLDRERKQKVLEIYCHKLDERERRKEFVCERNLTDSKLHQSLDKKRSKDELELREKLKVFMRLMSPDEMDRFVRGLLDEKELRAKVEMLKNGRIHGATTPEECQRLHTKAVKKELRMSNSSIVGGTAANSSALSTGGAAGGNGGGGGGGGNGANMSSSSASAGGGGKGLSSGGKSMPGGSGIGNKSGAGGEASIISGASSQRRGRRSSTGGGSANVESMSEVVQGGSLNGHHHHGHHGHHHSRDGHHHYHHGHHHESRDRRWILQDMDIEAMAGAELLSAKEINLCRGLDLMPQQYLIVKEVMIRESARNGYLRKKDVRAIVKLDNDKHIKIHAYLSSCGWIRSGTSGGGGSGASGPGSSNASIGNGIRSAPSGGGGGTSGSGSASGPGGGASGSANVSAGTGIGTGRIGGGNNTSNGNKPQQSERT